MSSAKKRILLVDDDEDLLEALVRSHRKHYDLVPACGAEEGLRKLEEEGPFCVIVSDYHMPVMNGVAFLAVPSLENGRRRMPGSEVEK